MRTIKLTFGIILFLLYSCGNDDSNSEPTVENTIIGNVSTLAGSTSGNEDGTGTVAKFFNLSSMCNDSQGNLYVVDGSTLIKKITPQGVVSTYTGSAGAGYLDGTLTTSKFQNIKGIAIDNTNALYVTDVHRIRKISSTGSVTTIAGDATSGYLEGPFITAKFNDPQGIAVSNNGIVYIADRGNNRIRKIENLTVFTVSGSSTSGSADGTGTAASFLSGALSTLYFNEADAALYVAEGTKIRKVTPTGVVTTLAGSNSPGATDGNLTTATFFRINGITKDGNNNLYVTDIGSPATATVRKINLSTSTVTTLAGSEISPSPMNGGMDGTGTNASFNTINGIVHYNNNLFVAEQFKIRKIN
jgi:hypothetical protein